MKTTHLLLIFAIIAILLPSAAIAGQSTRDWDKAIKLAREIHVEHGEFDSDEVLIKLNEIKDSIVDVGQNIPVTLEWKDRDLVIAAVGLYKAIEVGGEKCLHTYLPIINDNFHRLNYMQLNQKLRFIYRDNENMLNMLLAYFNIQFMLCRNGLLAHFATKATRLRQKQKQADYFRATWNSSFTEKAEKLTNDLIIASVSQYMRNYVPRERMEITLNDDIDQFRNTYTEFVQTACEQNLLYPFETIMMTYDMIKRSLLLVEDYHGDIVRAYDLCQKVLNTIDGDAMIVLRQHMLANRHIEPQRIDVILPPIVPGSKAQVLQATDASRPLRNLAPKRVESSYHPYAKPRKATKQTSQMNQPELIMQTIPDFESILPEQPTQNNPPIQSMQAIQPIQPMQQMQQMHTLQPDWFMGSMQSQPLQAQQSMQTMSPMQRSQTLHPMQTLQGLQSLGGLKSMQGLSSMPNIPTMPTMQSFHDMPMMPTMPSMNTDQPTAPRIYRPKPVMATQSQMPFIFDTLPSSSTPPSQLNIGNKETTSSFQGVKPGSMPLAAEKPSQQSNISADDQTASLITQSEPESPKKGFTFDLNELPEQD